MENKDLKMSRYGTVKVKHASIFGYRRLKLLKTKQNSKKKIKHLTKDFKISHVLPTLRRFLKLQHLSDISTNVSAEESPPLRHQETVHR